MRCTNERERRSGVPDYELDFWGSCCNTWHEEQKQFSYAGRMGLYASWHSAHPPTYDIGGRSVLDVGGGPASLLLKCVNLGYCVVCDPGRFPAWVNARYRECGIEHWTTGGEGLSTGHDFDEAWIYNVLQHVDDPALVLERVRDSARTLRIFEWVDIEPYPGHPHKLTQELLEKWIGGPGFTANINENGAVGRAFYGVYDLRAE